jgi:hypothetical protein
MRPVRGGRTLPVSPCTPGSSDDEEVRVLPELWPLKFGSRRPGRPGDRGSEGGGGKAAGRNVSEPLEGHLSWRRRGGLPEADDLALEWERLNGGTGGRWWLRLACGDNAIGMIRGDLVGSEQSTVRERARRNLVAGGPGVARWLRAAWSVGGAITRRGKVNRCPPRSQTARSSAEGGVTPADPPPGRGWAARQPERAAVSGEGADRDQASKRAPGRGNRGTSGRPPSGQTLLAPTPRCGARGGAERRGGAGRGPAVGSHRRPRQPG